MQNFSYLLISIICIIALLIAGQSLLIPFILGLLLWFIMRELKYILSKIPFVSKYLPTWLLSIFSGLIVLLIVTLIINILTRNITTLSYSYEKYQSNISIVIDQLNALFKTDIVERVQSHVGDFNFGTILGTIFNSISSIMGNLFMILIYALFVVFEESNFQLKIEKIFTDRRKYRRFMMISRKVERSVSRYLGMKTLVSLITGIASYIALILIGIDSPEFWAFLIFILNYIPTVGSLIATAFPAIFALLQFVEFWPCLMVIIFVGAIQLIVGNIIEPRVMGSSMNISPLVTIIALSFWGLIWGIIGMILSVPITVVMIIILSQFEKTHNIAILLSQKGNV